MKDFGSLLNYQNNPIVGCESAHSLILDDDTVNNQWGQAVKCFNAFYGLGIACNESSQCPFGAKCERTSGTCGVSLDLVKNIEQVFKNDFFFFF